MDKKGQSKKEKTAVHVFEGQWPAERDTTRKYNGGNNSNGRWTDGRTDERKDESHNGFVAAVPLALFVVVASMTSDVFSSSGLIHLLDTSFCPPTAPTMMTVPASQPASPSACLSASQLSSSSVVSIYTPSFASPRLVLPRLDSPRLASPRLASHRFSSSCLNSSSIHSYQLDHMSLCGFGAPFFNIDSDLQFLQGKSNNLNKLSPVPVFFFIVVL
ncbi:unnamed protein product [Soboliphyme baturini]|uniref:Transmembrane protein n=1 Tax=Soboliphyme baturini TaxID=241478 RepID=A0A183J1G1_9BILA|nr:unnamed protein product [Soboliphyme baturini]